MAKHKVFISYSRQYVEWVRVLADNLKLCGVTAFVDERDIGAGRSWVSCLQEGLSRAEKVVLVATPEALASPWVRKELDAALSAKVKEGGPGGPVLVAMLVDTPLPPFLEMILRLDFTEHDRDKYLLGMQQLLAGIRGRDTLRDLPELPSGITVPEPPDVGLPGELRGRIVRWAAQALESRVFRRALAPALEQPRHSLDGFGSPECAASAAMVLATGSDDQVNAASRFVELVLDELGEVTPGLEDGARPLLKVLEGAQPGDKASGLLGTYLKRVEEDHSNLVPYFREKGGVEVLDRVYVRLDLQADARMLREEMHERFSAEALCIKELLQLDASWVTGRWVVRGDPGSGKTTLLRHLAWELCRDADRPWVPLYAPIPALVRDELGPVEREDRRFRRAFGKEVLGQVLDREAREGRLLLLLDGLDEVPREMRDEAEDLLRSLGRRWPDTPVVVTTRPIGYQSLSAGYREVEVQPLDRARRVEFLSRWFARVGEPPDTARAEDAVRQLEGPLWELSGTPLYLTLMAILLQEGEEPSRNRAALYDQVFDLLLEGRHRPGVEPMPLREPTEVALRHLGFGMTRDNRDSDPPGTLETRLYDMEDEKSLNRLERRWQREMRNFLGALAERTGILGPHDGEGSDWRFWHRSFREALASQQVAEKVKAGGLQVCLDQAREVKGDESRWAEPFALLSGRVEQPDQLLKQLMGANRELGLRALATAQTVSPEALRDVLEPRLGIELRRRPVLEPCGAELIQATWEVTHA